MKSKATNADANAAAETRGKDYNLNRRAPQPLRDEAAKWAKLYRNAQAAGGRLVVNPDDDPEDHLRFDGTDPEFLIRLLEDFAATGRFTEPIDTRPMEAKRRAASMPGTSQSARVKAVMKEFSTGDRNAQRLLSGRRVNDKSCTEPVVDPTREFDEPSHTK
jgi:hypothetical protein